MPVMVEILQQIRILGKKLVPKASFWGEVLWNCEQPTNNFRYTLKASAWSDCRVLLDNILAGGDQMRQGMSSSGSCGGGTRSRNISCLLTSSKQPVDMSFCIHLPQLHRVER